MRSQTVIGIAFLVMAAGLGAFELLLPQFSTVETPENVAVQASGAPQQSELSANSPDWESEQPSHERFPARKHPVKLHRRPAAHPHRAPAHPHRSEPAPMRPLAAPTFLPIAPRPAPTVRVDIGIPSSSIEVTQPLVRPILPPVRTHVHPRLPRPHRPNSAPTAIRALPTFSPEDLARQRALERQALVNAAIRSARGEVMRTVFGGVVLLSAEAEDNGTAILVVVVEQRASGTVVEQFTFTPGPNGLGLSRRRVISQNYADPFISH
jgi:hypothetical protein